jgi:hypothetical protein
LFLILLLSFHACCQSIHCQVPEKNTEDMNPHTHHTKPTFRVLWCFFFFQALDCLHPHIPCRVQGVLAWVIKPIGLALLVPLASRLASSNRHHGRRPHAAGTGTGLLVVVSKTRTRTRRDRQTRASATGGQVSTHHPLRVCCAVLHRKFPHPILPNVRPHLRRNMSSRLILTVFVQ